MKDRVIINDKQKEQGKDGGSALSLSIKRVIETDG